MAIYVPPRPAVVAKASPIGQGAGVLQSEFPLSVLGIGPGGNRSPQKRMQKAWALSFEVPWIAAAEDAITGRFANVPWHLEDENDEEVTDAHPSEDARAAKALIEFPSRGLKVGAPFYRSDLWGLTARAMGICGSGFILLDQTEALAGTPAAMLPLAPWRLWEQEDANGNLVGWWVDRTNTSPGIPLRLDELLHFPLRRRFDGHFGIGLIESAFLKPDLANALDRHLSLLLSAGGRLSGIMSPKEGVIEPETMLSLERDWRTIVEQADAAKRLQLVRAPVEFQKTTLTPQEMMVRDLMDGARDDLLALWGVPFTMIGGASPAGLNSGDSRKFDEAALWQGPVHTRLSIFVEVMQYQLLDRWAALGTPVELEVEEPSFDDDAPRYELLTKSLSTPLTNEQRLAIIGLPPTGDPAIDNAILLPVNMVTYAVAPPKETDQAQVGKQAAPEVAAVPTPQLLAAGETAEKGSTERFRTSLARLRENLQRRVTPRLTASVADALADQKRDVVGRLRRHGSQVLADPRKTSVWWNEAEQDKRMKNALLGHLSAVADTVSAHVGETFAARKAEPVDRLLSHGVTRVKGINATTKDAIIAALVRSIEDGGSLDDAIAAVEDAATFDPYRAELISRTELMFAYNAAALGGYEDAGLTRVEAIDGDEDPECAARNGQEYPIDEAMAIEDHPNGTLDWVPVLV